MKKKKIVLIAFGTRPEALKFVPLIRSLRSGKQFKVFVCLTGQHREMLDQVIGLFRIKIDFDLKLMSGNQSLDSLAGKVVSEFGKIIDRVKPDLIFVQGDTTTALMVALSGFHAKIPIAHLEAGLRSSDKYSPFPEEMNRTLISHLADYHFTPTHVACEHLIREGISKRNIFEVGNTIVDTIKLATPMIKKNYPVFDCINLKNKILFVTAHRRESFGPGLAGIFTALKRIVSNFKNVEIVYPVHLNPNVMVPAKNILGGAERIHLIKPLTYEETYWIMNKCYAILTDSGGIQEEAPSFKKPVLVMREVTERREGIDAGIAKLVGTDPNLIFQETKKLLTSKRQYNRMTAKKNPYGDGLSADRINAHLKKLFI